MELRSQLLVLRRRLVLVVAAFAVTLFNAGVASFVLPKSYQAQATLLIGNAASSVSPSLDQALLSQRLSVTYASVATQRATLQRVVDKLGLPFDADKLAARVSADAPQDSSLVQITARDSDPARAAAIANAIAADVVVLTPEVTGRDPNLQSFIDDSLAKTRGDIADTQSRIDELVGTPDRSPADDAQLTSLQSRLASLQSAFATLLSLASGSSANEATLTDPAVPPVAPVSPNLALNLVLGAIGGLLLGLLLAFVAEQLDDSLRSTDEVEGAVGVPALGSLGTMRIGKGSRKLYWLAMLLYPRGHVAETFRTLRTNLEFTFVDAPVRTLLVTSPLPGDGKTTVAANLAVAFAQAGRRTVLVDADLRRPAVHEIFGIADSAGLTGLVGQTDPDVAQALVTTDEPNLRVLPAGSPPPNPAELLGSKWFGSVLASLAGIADIVVLDSAPHGVIADAAVLAARADATIVVARAGRTSRAAVRRSVQGLVQTGARVVGVALNGVRQPSGAAYAGYYVTGEPPSESPSSPPPPTSEPRPASRGRRRATGEAAAQ